MSVVKFKQLLDIAILPIQEKVEEPQLHDTGSRWIHTRRVKGVCWPYRIAKEVGWTIVSPIDIAIQPVQEIQTSADNPAEFARLKQLMPMEDWVQKKDVLIGISPAAWYKVHEYSWNGLFYPMFLPNGEGTFEWRQGWSVEVPDSHVVLFQPVETQDGRFIAYPGLLAGPAIARVQERIGMPIAFEPVKACRIRRGEPIAKMLVLPKSVLGLKSEYIPL
ncbi:hypothetical protein [Paenibacillus koleovorans]|uniref:hypothetical protein n=1 Tax=Paenibacillus koleovorans TaxID=121608 RepID=UPI000FDAA7F4|nr:hypothetical protein [Paenibacillus koleovorans]